MKSVKHKVIFVDAFDIGGDFVCPLVGAGQFIACFPCKDSLVVAIFNTCICVRAVDYEINCLFEVIK